MVVSSVVVSSVVVSSVVVSSVVVSSVVVGWGSVVLVAAAGSLSSGRRMRNKTIARTTAPSATARTSHMLRGFPVSPVGGSEEGV